jgi:hypothetical protein
VRGFSAGLRTVPAAYFLFVTPYQEIGSHRLQAFILGAGPQSPMTIPRLTSQQHGGARSATGDYSLLAWSVAFQGGGGAVGLLLE